jgi:hypothetical protein
MRRGASLLLCALLWAAPAAAELMAWDGTVSILSPLVPRELEAPLHGVATVLDNGNGATLQTLRPLGTALGTDVYLVTDPEAGSLAAIRLEASVGIGTLAPFDPPAALSERQLVQNALAIRGVLRLCFLSATCPGSIPSPLGSAAGAAGVGVGGFVTAIGPGSARISVEGAPWTLRTTTVALQTASGATYQIPTSGSAHGPLSFTGSTAVTGGQLSLVTPIRITSNLASLDSGAIGRLTIRLVPEPGFLVLVASGIGGLWLLPRRRSPRPRDRDRPGRSQEG